MGGGARDVWTHRLDVLEGVDGGCHERVEGAEGHDGEDVGGVDDQGVLSSFYI